MDQKRLGVGIIGAGRISRSHIEACLELKDLCEIKALSDPVLENGKKYADEFGLNIQFYNRYEEMLTRKDIDIVSVCTPPSVRVQPVTAALAAGKHVMCEKSFAASLEEYDQMMTAARKYDRKLAVMLQSRCDTNVLRIKHVVDSGMLGPVLYARAQDHHWRGDPYYLKEWRGTWEKERGGALMNLGIHVFDVFLWILGEIESVKAYSGALGHAIETDDVTAAVIRFRTGAIGVFSCTTTFPDEGAMMEFGGKYRMVRHPPEIKTLKAEWDGFGVEDEEGKKELQRKLEEIKPRREDFAGVYEEFFNSLLENRGSLTDASLIRATVEAVTAIYKSAATGEEVKLPITPNDPWYTTRGIHERMKPAITKRTPLV